MLVTAWANSTLPLRLPRMTARVTVPHDRSAGEWKPDPMARAAHYCQQLEPGEILYFGRSPFAVSRDDCAFLMQESRGGSRLHKNVSYRHEEDALRGFSGSANAQQNTKRILREY